MSLLGTEALLLEVRVPQYQTRGDDAQLYCHYSLEGATLYSIKWYKGDKQFYQYIPVRTTAINSFQIAGVNVDVSLELAHCTHAA